MGRVWPGAIVEENTLQAHISAVRQALGPDRGMLKTVSGRGYRLIGSWDVRAQPQGSRDAEATAVTPFATNLPAAAARLIGREGAVRQLTDLLSAYRVVTLTGPGGIGKTAVALEVARRMVPDFQGDIRIVELASLSDPALVPSAVATALGLKLGGGEMSSDAVARAIGGKKLLWFSTIASTSSTRRPGSPRRWCVCARARRSWPPAARCCASRGNMSIGFRRWTCRRATRQSRAAILEPWRGGAVRRADDGRAFGLCAARR